MILIKCDSEEHVQLLALLYVLECSGFESLSDGRLCWTYFVVCSEPLGLATILQLFYHGATTPSGPRPAQYQGSTITPGQTTLGRTLLDEWSARRRDLYQTTYNTQTRQISLPPAGFEPTIPASERPQTHA